MLKHSIVMITYNQENLVGLALDSALNQVPMPYEIVIGEDCSTDNTYSVLEKYQEKHPSIIKITRNEKNLGIFGNQNNISRKITGDIISFLSGDDLFKPGLLNSLNKIVEENYLNPLEEEFIIIYNTILLYPNGKEKIFNNYRIRKKSMFKERLRYGLSFRDVGISRKLWDSVSPVRTDLGLYADWLLGFEQVIKAKKFIFVDEAYSVYRLSSGITTNTPKLHMHLSYKTVLDEITKVHKERLDSLDMLYIKYLKSRTELRIKPYIINYLQTAFYYFVNCILLNFSVNNTGLFNSTVLIPPSIIKVLKRFINKLQSGKN